MHRPRWFHGTYAACARSLARTHTYVCVFVCVFMHRYEYTMRVAAAFQTIQRPVFVYFLAFHLCAYFKLIVCTAVLVFTFNSVTSFLSVKVALLRYVSCNRSKREKLTAKRRVKKHGSHRPYSLKTYSLDVYDVITHRHKQKRKRNEHQYAIHKHAMALCADTQYQYVLALLNFIVM